MTTERLTGAEYKAVQDQVTVLAQVVLGLDLDAFIEQAEHADAMGPYLDPTLWMRGHEGLSRLLRVAHALRTCQAEIKAANR